MNKKAISILLLFISYTAYPQEQKSISTSSIYIDGGLGLISSSSLNFEYKLLQSYNETWIFKGRIGAAVALGFHGPSGSGVQLASTLLYHIHSAHWIDSNAGLLVLYGNDAPYVYDAFFYIPLLELAYRYQKPEGGLLIKAKLSSVGIGLGIGYAF